MRSIIDQKMLGIKPMNEPLTWSAWTPLVNTSFYETVCHLSGIRASLLRRPDGTFEGWFLGHYTKKYPTVAQATNALVQCIYRHIGRQEQQLGAIRDVLKEGILPPVWEEEAQEGNR